MLVTAICGGTGLIEGLQTDGIVLQGLNHLSSRA
jgi:hypothetical protein